MDSSVPVPTLARERGHPPIQNRYTFSYMRRKGRKNESYADQIKSLGTFGSVSEFWSIYNHIVRPDDITTPTELHLFKKGISPMWEDESNARGGKWTVRLKKGLASNFWEELLLAIIGEQFDVGNEICGAVCSVRGSEDIISIWNRNADNTDALNKIRDHVRRLFKLPTFVSVDYKRHDSAGWFGDRPRRNSSVGSETDTRDEDKSSHGRSSAGSKRPSGGEPKVAAKPGTKWRSRRMMMKNKGDSAADDSLPPWMRSDHRPPAAAPAAPAAEGEGNPAGTRTARGPREGGSSWGRKPKASSTSNSAASSGGSDAGSAAEEPVPAGSTFWRTAGAEGHTRRGGFGDRERGGNNRWRNSSGGSEGDSSSKPSSSRWGSGGGDKPRGRSGFSHFVPAHSAAASAKPVGGAPGFSAHKHDSTPATSPMATVPVAHRGRDPSPAAAPAPAPSPTMAPTNPWGKRT